MPPSLPNIRARDLSQKLHTSVAQQLTAASMIAHILSERLHTQGSPEAAIAKDLVEKLNVTSSQLRDIMSECEGPPGA